MMNLRIAALPLVRVVCRVTVRVGEEGKSAVKQAPDMGVMLIGW